MQDERRLDGFLSSTPSPRTRDGEELLLEVGGTRDSAARIPKGRVCAHRTVGAKTGLIGREERSHEASETRYHREAHRGAQWTMERICIA